MGLKMNLGIITKNHAADSKIRSPPKKSILEPMGLTLVVIVEKINLLCALVVSGFFSKILISIIRVKMKLKIIMKFIHS